MVPGLVRCEGGFADADESTKKLGRWQQNEEEPLLDDVNDAAMRDLQLFMQSSNIDSGSQGVSQNTTGMPMGCCTPLDLPLLPALNNGSDREAKLSLEGKVGIRENSGYSPAVARTASEDAAATLDAAR